MLSVLFIAAFLATAGGLALAQSQTDDSTVAMDHGTQGAHGAKAPSGSDTPPADNPAGNPAVRGYTAANDRMHADMAIAFTGDAEVDFMRGMIPTSKSPSTWRAWSWSTAQTRRCAL